ERSKEQRHHSDGRRARGTDEKNQLIQVDAECFQPLTTPAHEDQNDKRGRKRAGWPVRRVLTDGGPEFKGAFDAACRRLGIRHTRTKPRHAWTNGFVERLQGTILQEHWRVAFRRRYFTTRAALQRSLTEFMRYYNDERPHQGYRLRGRTPSTLVWGAVKA